MRFTLVLLGHTLDLSLEPTAADEPDPGRSLDGGTTASTPVGFTASYETPDMVGLPPDRSNGWPDEDGGR